MIIAHFSDTHGLPRKPVPKNADIIVHTGDQLPNRTRGNRDIEIPYQREWIAATARDWKVWAGGRKIIRVPGNHDFYPSVAALMRSYGMDVHDVFFEGPVTIDGIKFTGVPYIPPIIGEWEHETPEGIIADQFRRRVVAERPDVILNHCPPHGILDSSSRDFGIWSEHIGSVAIGNILKYEDWVPRAYLCGHNHDQGGASVVHQHRGGRQCLYVNAATQRALIEIQPGTAPAIVKSRVSMRAEPRVPSPVSIAEALLKAR